MSTRYNKVISFFVFFLILLFTASIEAKTVLSEQELKEKIIDNKIYKIYLSKEGIVASGFNQYGVPQEEDFIVLGSYDKIPDDLYKLARQHNVAIFPSQIPIRNNTYKALLPFVGWVLYITMLVGIFVVLIIMNKKVSRILEIMIKQQ